MISSKRDFKDVNDAAVFRSESESASAEAKHPMAHSPMFFRRNGSPVDLIDLYRGQSVFLICNGPSFSTIDQGQLKQPGILTFGMNNGAHSFRTCFWACVDDRRYRPGFANVGLSIQVSNLLLSPGAGEIVAYAGRWPGDPPEGTPKYKLPQGFRKSLELFNVERAIREPAQAPLVIVEGFFDVMNLHQHGCRKVVALMGSNMSGPQEELIRRCTIRTGHIIVLLDEDDAGRLGRDDIALRLSRHAYVHVHGFSDTGKQPDEMSAEEVAALLG